MQQPEGVIDGDPDVAQMSTRDRTEDDFAEATAGITARDQQQIDAVVNEDRIDASVERAQVTGGSEFASDRPAATDQRMPETALDDADRLDARGRTPGSAATMPDPRRARPATVLTEGEARDRGRVLGG